MKLLNFKMETKGKGAGGSGTNKNGLPFEECVNEIQIENFTYKKQYEFVKYMRPFENKNFNSFFKPDGAYISNDFKNVYILECKFQNCAGSVDEKLLSSVMKLELYKNKYPGINFFYAFVLSPWFKTQKKYNDWYKILKEQNIVFFYGKETGEIKLNISYDKSGQVKLKISPSYKTNNIDIKNWISK
jgi:hypothetical protein